MRPRWLVLSSSLLLFPLGAPGQPPPAPPSPPAAPAPSSVSFDPSSAAPYFDKGPGVEARRRFAAGDWKSAARLFDAYAREHARAHDVAAARFLAAYALSKAGAFVEAAERFDRLVGDYPLLADHHRLHAARARLAAKQHGAALAAARAVADDSPLAPEALLVRAEAERATSLDPAARASSASSAAAATADYRAYLSRYPDSWRIAEVRYKLATALEETDPAAAREQYREVYLRFPTSGFATEARTRLAALGPEALRLSAADHLVRGLALFEQMRNEDSEAELAAALAGKDLAASQQCVAAFHRAQSVFKQRNRPRAAPLFDEAVATCERAPKDDAASADLHAKALYQGARCHAARKEPGAAVRRFARIEAEHPTHSYADDARVRIAEIIDDVLRPRNAVEGAPGPAGKADLPELATLLDALAQAPAGRETPALAPRLRGVRDELLAGVADRYPQGDMGGEALFRLALHALEDGRLPEAKALLDKELRIYPREEGWWEAGRTLYWLARIAALQHKPADATALYTRAVREYPLSYYALQAFARLRELDADGARRLVESLRTPGPSADELAWRFPADPVYGTAAFRRGVELARLGLGSEARRELSAAGIRTLGRGGKLDDPSREPQLWLAAVLYDRAGEWALSHAIPRYVLVDYARRWPLGDNRKRWLLSFPHGYEPLVVEHAGKNGQPAALQFAIIREESAFDPTDESFANAVGLTQLTQDPARRFAQGLPYTREALRDPVINITIGARELGDLWKRTAGQPALTIAGYNAGEGAVRRWMRAAPADQPLDLFIEHIPYDETRGYTKRVLGSYFAYQFLYQDKDPVPWLSSSLRSF